MNSPVKIVFENLSDFYYTMLLRKEAYQHASQLQNFTNEDKVLFSSYIKDSESSISRMSARLDDISKNVKELIKVERPPLKCSFYYAMAKSTSIVTTVCLSLQLGDTWFIKNFEELLVRTEMKHLKNIKDDVKGCLDCLKVSLQNEQYMNNIIARA
ncbi:hypothetical protein [uncultured Arcticibacterium sp.]|uniref:hypothetical protein n=1 Tax=uncultured Arcticibacterium sp. TaxID=2173042 RepID=UPI0030FCFED8